MGARIGLGIALLLALPASVPASGAARQELVLTGSSSAYVDVTFSRPLRVYDTESVATTKGRYAGFFMYRLGERPSPDPGSNTAGGLYTPRLVASAPGRPAVPFGFRDTLAAGRYRVYLLADAAATLRVPVTGLARSLRLAPRKRVRSGLDVREASAVTDLPGNAVTGISEPLTVGTHTWATAVMQVYSDVPNAYVESLQACITTKGAFDCPQAVSGYGESVEFAVATAVVSHAPPGTLKPGAYVGLEKRLGAGTTSRVIGLAFWFDVV